MKYEKKLEILRSAQGLEPAQFAALCTRRKGGNAEILMITSRDTGRWILPKGWRMPDRSEGESALTEAWEEAGVIGRLTGPAIGTYATKKALPVEGEIPCKIAVYPVQVDKLAVRYPEKGQRKRKWMSPSKAAKAVSEPELAELLRNLRLH